MFEKQRACVLACVPASLANQHTYLNCAFNLKIVKDEKEDKIQQANKRQHHHHQQQQLANIIVIFVVIAHLLSLHSQLVNDATKKFDMFIALN